LLIFDEVITGFRLSLGGAQEYFGVKADIVTLGKIIGGGMPIGAVVSSAEIMKNLAPLGKVFNAGTFNAHPLAMAAGLATIEVLEEGETYTIASAAAKAIAKAIEDAAQSVKLDIYVNQVESMLTPFFNKHEVIDAKTARASNRALYEKFHIEMLKRKVFVTPSQFEAIFTGLPIRGEVLDKVIEAVYGAFRSLGELSK
ncbi:MAG: aminotransferase class III-fold pyridoxal phosphate-dependent enzyme, partial [Acidilobaceae archaeon]